MRISQRHHQKNDSNTRMRCPSQRRRDEDAQQRVAGDGSKELSDGRRLLGGRERVEKDVEREKHQAKADGNGQAPW